MKLYGILRRSGWPLATALAALVLPASLAGAAGDSAPRTKITGHEVDAVAGAASFKFGGSGGDGKLSFQCRLDAGAFHRCRSPKSYQGLASGEHVFNVRARDHNGDRDRTPAKFRFTITGSTGTPQGTRMLGVSLAGNGVGSVTSDAGEIDCGSVCSAAYDVGSTVTLTATPAAGSTFTGWSGAGCSGSAQCTVTIDDSKAVTATFTAPETTILTGPAGHTKNQSPSFTFASNEPGTFECRITSPFFEPCTTPFTPASPLQDGFYIFEARAIDEAGNADSTAATRSFTVDTVAPETTILTGPPGHTKNQSPSFTFASNEPGTVECRITSPSSTPAFGPCGSPFTPASPLQDASYTFEARAIDEAGNADSTAATRSFTVDTVAPETTVFGPQDNLLPYVNGYTEDQTPDSTFFSSEPGTFECRITSVGSSPAFAPCSSPFTPASPLPRDAFYTIEARAIDEAGNVDPTPGAWNFDVETPITENQQTADLAAATYFPDAAHTDVPATCGGTTPIDCPGGTPLPPDHDQLSTASSRTVVWAGANSHRYNVSVTHDSQTLHPVVATISGSDCNLTWNSANGANSHWTITEELGFVIQPSGHTVPGGKFISPSNSSVTGVESSDYAFGGSIFCSAVNPSGFGVTLASQYASFVGADESLCPALGPGYLAPCSP